MKIQFFGLDRQYKNLRDELLDATDVVLRTGVWMNGSYTGAFETWLANKTKTNFAVTVHSGTQALEIMAKWAKEPHDSLWQIKPVARLPNITYVATLNAFLNAGYEIELVDTDKNGLMTTRLDESELLSTFGKITCTVGLYGANPPLANELGLTPRLVDGAQHWLVADYIGDGMAISFDPTKNLNSSGNGGAIVTNDIDLYNFAYSYRSNSKDSHKSSGTNSRMSELDCAHLLVRTKHLDKWQWRRKEIRHFYLDEFKNIELRCLSRDFIVHADQKFVVYTDCRDELYDYLIKNNIEVKIHYPKALSELPLSDGFKIKPDMLSTSVMLTKGLLSLPIYPELSDAEVEKIVKKVKDFFTN